MPKQRNLVIDRFRGGVIMFMVVGNDMANVAGFPAIFRHAPHDRAFTLADMGSKFFIFAIAATYAMSFNRRAAAGSKKDAYFHFVSRYLAIMGLGALFGVFNAAWTGDTVWGTLHNIGLAGLMTLLVIRLPAWARALAGLAVLAANQLLFHFAPGQFTGEIGAVLEGLSMAAALMLSTVMVELFNKGMKPFLIGTGVLSLAAWVPILAGIVPFTKRNMISFILASVSVACVLYLIAELASKALPKRPGLICWWGENPMLLYILHLMLTGAAMALDPRPMWLAIPVDLAILSILSLIAWQLHRKKLQISF